jgi:hypothetical protein
VIEEISAPFRGKNETGAFLFVLKDEVTIEIFFYDSIMFVSRVIDFKMQLR